MFAALSLLYIYWSSVDGILLNRVTNQDFITYQTDKNVYYPGDAVFVSVKGFCKLRNIPSQTFINLVDTILVPYNVQNRSIPKGCVDENKYYFFTTIPNIDLPDGVYYFNGYHQYNINPIRKGDEGVQVHFKSNEFQINSHKIQAID